MALRHLDRGREVRTLLDLAQATASPDREVVCLDCGHIGVVVGAEGPRTFYPLVDR